MLGIPVASMYALDVLIENDFDYANKYLLAISNAIAPAAPYMSYLMVSAVIATLLTVLASFFQFGRDRLSAVASEGIARKLREVLFDRIHHAKASFFDKQEVGDLVQRCTSDVETIRRFMHSDLDSMARALLLLAVMFPVLFWRNPTLAWYSLLLMPVILAGGIVFFMYVSVLFRDADEAEGRLTAVLQENLTGVRVVQAFAQEELEFDRFDRASGEFRSKYIRLNKYESIYWGISDFVCMAQTGLVLILGGSMVVNNQLSIGELFLFTYLSGIVIWRIRQLIDIVEHTGKARVSMSRVNSILSAEQEPVQPVPASLKVVNGAIEFEGVSFSYDDENEHLHEVSLSIAPGETIGIVGKPGSGKSTLLRALMRFYPISKGRILLDGVDIHSLDVQWLREQIACVLQEPFLFSNTVQQNLKFGKLDATDEQIHSATESAAIRDSILQFPSEFQSRIGERGVNLSGGQRQRVAIARALVKQAPILILDDVLSGVDTRTESTILQNLEGSAQKPTTIVVAHRLTTIRKVDRIVVMDQGRIVQVGSHNELMSQPGPYHDLCDIQDLLDETIQYETERAAHG